MTLASFAQERMWFLDRLHPGTPTYNVPITFRLDGRLEVAGLRHALRVVVQRHESLRTTFPEVDGAPQPRLLPEVEPELELVDVSRLPRADGEHVADLRLRSEATRPFDLANGPLLRVLLIRLADDEHVLLLTVHHIVFDARSRAILIDELGAAYVGFLEGRDAVFRQLTARYADFAGWQRQRVDGEGRSQLAFWREQLARLPLLSLPYDRPRPPVHSTRGDRLHVPLPPDLVAGLRALAASDRVTPFMILLAAFQVLLFRYSGQRDFGVGTPVSGRTKPEFSGVVGLFLNTLVLRADLSGEPTFRQVLSRTRDRCIEAFSRADMPFERLVEELSPERDPSVPPLFQVMLVVQHADQPPAAWPGVDLTPMRSEIGAAKFDLTLSVTIGTDRLGASWEYSADLFDAETVARMAADLSRLLREMVSDPDRLIGRIDLAHSPEGSAPSTSRSGGHPAHAPTRSIADRLDAEVRAHPDATAVSHGRDGLSYTQMSSDASALAERLRGLGAGHEARVGVYLPRSLDLAVALLGVLKVGATYVPLDPSLPRGRLVHLAHEARCTVVLAPGDTELDLPTLRMPVLRLGGDRAPLGRPSALETAPRAADDSLAYIVFTSGSTGRPKPVGVTRRALANLVGWQLEQPGFERAARTLQFASPGFDVSLQEMLTTWCSGGHLVIAPDECRGDPVVLLRVLRQEGVQRLFLPFVALQQVADTVAGGDVGQDLTDLRVATIITAGEQLRVTRQVSRLCAELGRCRLTNQYGPSETHVVTSFDLTGDPASWPALPPIGRPVANAEIHVLDPGLLATPVNVAGELYVGGAAVGRGYPGHPGLTAERFLPDPFASQPGARMYRTGDLAARRRDGNLAFLGRTDQQVKVHGHRVEPGEVEVRLTEHAGVKEAAVVHRNDVEGGELVAYLVADGAGPSPVALRSFLRDQLPAYMIPSAFVFLKALPTNANGKVDREQLPAPDASARGVGEAYVAPRTDVETTIARVWAEILRRERVGVRDRFFDMGANSLNVAQAASRLSARLGVEVPVRDLLLHPDTEALAASLERRRPAPSQQTPAAPDADTPPITHAHVTVERRPLVALVATGDMAPVDAAAIGYLPDAMMRRTGLDRAAIRSWFDDMPTLTSVRETHLGRIATIALPRFASELYQDERGLVELVVKAIRLSATTGARVVSLTGLIPSATRYGHAVERALGERWKGPRITTGHATTTSAVVLSVSGALGQTGRELSGERLACVGLGSIGSTSLRLLLRWLPHPRRITLCDIPGKRAELRRLADQLRDDLGFRGRVDVVEADAEVPDQVYDATLVVGATNVPGVLDVQRVRPGTIVLDDSAPHCFEDDAAVQRMTTSADVVAAEAGSVRSAREMRELRYVPAGAPQLATVGGQDPFEITSCVVSALLSASPHELPTTLGPVGDDVALQHLQALLRLGFRPARIRLGGYVVPDELLFRFRAGFGTDVHVEVADWELVRSRPSNGPVLGAADTPDASGRPPGRPSRAT